jgi:hypothetical protein
VRALPGTNQSSGPSSALWGTNQSSIPAKGDASLGGLGWTMIRGRAPVRSHCGSAGANAPSESNGIGSPACAGNGKEKGSPVGEPLFARRIEMQGLAPSMPNYCCGSVPKSLTPVFDLIGRYGRTAGCAAPSRPAAAANRHEKARRGFPARHGEFQFSEQFVLQTRLKNCRCLDLPRRPLIPITPAVMPVTPSPVISAMG